MAHSTAISKHQQRTDEYHSTTAATATVTATETTPTTSAQHSTSQHNTVANDNTTNNKEEQRHQNHHHYDKQHLLRREALWDTQPALVPWRRGWLHCIHPPEEPGERLYTAVCPGDRRAIAIRPLPTPPVPRARGEMVHAAAVPSRRPRTHAWPSPSPPWCAQCPQTGSRQARRPVRSGCRGVPGGSWGRG